MRFIVPAACRVWLLGAAVAYCVVAQSSPIDIVFALDVNSTVIRMQRQIAPGARLAVDELRPGDRVAVISFASGIKTHLPLSSDQKRIAEAFQKASGWRVVKEDRVRLHDALLAALKLFPAAEGERRRMVIVVTNDVDKSSEATAQEVVNEALRQKISITGVVLTDPSLPLSVRVTTPDPNAAKAHLRTITEPTGGRISTVSITGYLLRELIAEAKRTS